MLPMHMAETRNLADEAGKQLRAALAAALTVAIAVVVGVELEKWISTRGISLIFIVAVVACASRSGFSAGLLSAIFAFLALNFFFIEPRHTFVITDQKELFSLGVFLVVAAITGSLAGRLREQVVEANQRADMLRILSEFSGKLFVTANESDILAALADQGSKAIQGPVVILHNNGESPMIEAIAPADAQIEPGEVQAAEEVFRKGHPVMATAPGWAGGRFEYRFIDKTRMPDKVIALAPHGGNRPVAPDCEQVLTTLMEQAALAIERLRFSKATEAANAAAQEEKLRSTLLSSVSHDLRTPLATILGSVTTLRELGGKIPVAAQNELLAAIEEETRRLSRLVANLLDMTKLQSGLRMRMDWVDVGDTIRSTVAAIRTNFANHMFDVKIEGMLPPLHCDPVLLGQVLFNLLENAVKFSPADQPILVSSKALENAVEIKITDRGTGIKPDTLPNIFDKFFTGDSGSKGAGLGLAIAKGIVEEMGGAIHAVSPGVSGVGTEMFIQFPVVTVTVGDSKT